MIIETITDNILWAIIAVLALNLFQRKYQARSRKKRVATLIVASLILLFDILLVVILQFKLPEWLGIPAFLIAVAVGVVFRRKIAIFKRTCPSCGTKLDLNTTLYFDDNLCTDCHKEQFPEQYKEPEPEVAEEEVDDLVPTEARDVSDIDWDEWEPTETAVVCYIFRDNEVMLIKKKRGLGHGLINAPGGRIEADETAREAAVRESIEETGIEPIDPVQVGILNFQFVDGYALKGYVFFAYDHKGEMVETDEADPFWAEIDRIPYDKMWEDDRFWLPEAIKGNTIEGFFIFDDRTMLSKDVLVSTPTSDDADA